ncbi:MAG: adenine phosphoribosyltransferase [Candidatus Omnitrophica bacterium]|nr:adenine phosphoribosyltransferase [Candidatus Omnitrophota bacterium]
MPTQQLKKFVIDIPDFPKKGIIFKDITTLLKNGEKFRVVVDSIVKKFKTKKIDAIVSIEARGFIVGSVVAYKLGIGIIPVRKKGKLPYLKYSVTYDLEYGTDTLEIHQDAFKKGARVLIVDDLLATGGTAQAVIKLIKKAGGEVAGLAFIIELLPLKGRDKLKGYPVYSLIKDRYC